MSDGTKLVKAFPCKLVEIPYPWDSYKWQCRMPLIDALNSWILNCSPLPIQFDKAHRMYPHGLLRALEEHGVQLGNRAYDEVISRLFKPCAEEEMAEFISGLIDDLSTYVHGRITVRKPLWVTKQNEYQHTRSGRTEFIRDEYWEVEVDQHAWVEGHAPPHYTFPESIDWKRGRMLLFDWGNHRKTVSLEKAWWDYIKLGLDVPWDKVTALRAQREEYDRLREEVKELRAKFDSAIEAQEPEGSIRRRWEIIQERVGKASHAWGDYITLQEDTASDKCADWERERIIGFVQTYGFPFIPFKSNIHGEPWQYYFDQFKRYYWQFMDIFGRMQQGKQYTIDDVVTLGRWINSEAALELERSEVNMPASDTPAVSLQERKKCSFISLARFLAQANKKLRGEQALGKLLEPLTCCVYCGSPMRKRPNIQYTQFAHCPNKACEEQARKDRRQYRLENDPGYREKVREQARERQATRRLRVKGQQ